MITTTSFTGVLHDSDGITGINFPYQLQYSQSGTILCTGFLTQSGIYEYDTSGNQLAFIDTEVQGFDSARGCYQLVNGNYLFTTPTGVHLYEASTGAINTVVTGISARMNMSNG